MDNNTKEKNFISAVVYCHNDVNNIGSFIENLDNTLSKNFLKYEIIIVNDFSQDNSIDIVKKYAAHKQGLVISILNMSFYQGLEASMNAGVNLSIGDFVYEFDSVCEDFDWDMLMRVYRHSLQGYDIVSAKSNSKPKLLSNLFYRIFNKYARLQYPINSESFRIISRRGINRIHSITQSIQYRKAAYANCGLPIDSLTYNPVKNTTRKSQPNRLKLAFDSLILYTDVAYRITAWFALIMLLISIVMGIYALSYWLLESPVEGWATTIIFIALGFSGLFIILAMVIKYLQTLISLSFKKKDYLFESINKLQ